MLNAPNACPNIGLVSIPVNSNPVPIYRQPALVISDKHFLNFISTDEELLEYIEAQSRGMFDGHKCLQQSKRAYRYIGITRTSAKCATRKVLFTLLIIREIQNALGVGVFLCDI
jgi:hypothetical protein